MIFIKNYDSNVMGLILEKPDFEYHFKEWSEFSLKMKMIRNKYK